MHISKKNSTFAPDFTSYFWTMDTIDINTLLAQADSAALFGKSVGGWFMHYEEIISGLKDKVKDQEAIIARLTEERDFYKNQCSPPDNIATTDASPPSNPPPEHDICFFLYTSGFMAEQCEKTLRKILDRHRSKAKVCMELRQEENKHFHLSDFTNEEKATLVNQFLPDKRKYKHFLASDFQKYFR